MQLPRWRPESEATISGEVCIVRLTVCQDGDHLPLKPRHFLENDNFHFREEVEAAVKETLGGEFALTSLTTGKGSIEIVAIIGTTFYAISRWKNFVESIELMVEQLKRVIRRNLERASPSHPTITATWTPGRGLVAVTQRGSEPRYENTSLVTWYLVLSHALMLITLLALLLWGKP